MNKKTQFNPIELRVLSELAAAPATGLRIYSLTGRLYDNVDALQVLITNKLATNYIPEESAWWHYRITDAGRDLVSGPALALTNSELPSPVSV